MSLMQHYDKIGTAHLRPEAGVGFEYLENR